MKEPKTDKNISMAGKVAIVLAIIAGGLAVTRAIYNYTQGGEWDIGKLALGLAMPVLMYTFIKSATAKR